MELHRFFFLWWTSVLFVVSYNINKLSTVATKTTTDGSSPLFMLPYTNQLLQYTYTQFEDWIVTHTHPGFFRFLTLHWPWLVWQTLEREGGSRSDWWGYKCLQSCLSVVESVHSSLLALAWYLSAVAWTCLFPVFFS